MNVDLTPELEQLIQQKIEGGRYRSPSDVIRVALLLLDEQEDINDREGIKATRQKVDVAIEELDCGEGIDGEKAIAQRQQLPDRDYGLAWEEWFQKLETTEPDIDRTTVKSSKSEIETILVEKYRKQGLEL